MCKNKKAKNSIFTAVMVSVFVITGTCVILFFVILSNIFGEKGLKGNLFDEKVLIKYEISWLKKPQNAVNERQYADSDSYVYDCELSSIEECLSYAEEVFTNFKNGNYVLAYCVNMIDDIWEKPCYEVELSDNLEDYCGSADLAADGFASYQFFYSTTPISEMGETFYGGKYMGHLYLRLWFRKFSYEENYRLAIILHVKKEKNSNILYLD